MLKFIPFLCLLSACTYSINMIHSSGEASDMIDETQSTSPEVTATIPLANGPGVPANYPPNPRGLNGPSGKA